MSIKPTGPVLAYHRFGLVSFF